MFEDHFCCRGGGGGGLREGGKGFLFFLKKKLCVITVMQGLFTFRTNHDKTHTGPSIVNLLLGKSKHLFEYISPRSLHLTSVKQTK